MGIDFKPDKPIYQQIMDLISSEIIRGKRCPGDRLTSVRDYAVEIGVNANTIQRVYQELERIGIVESRRGQGTFITENHNRLHQLREEMKQQYIQSFVSDMQSLGFSLREMIEGIHQYTKKGDDDDQA
ncbi:DNA-binding transcriptional regulator YhcF, GntR family [Salinibacillus kushneri]|uniref:DNA-binding transcriptional regulator YhcF, GntR family n=1 Tax=Salinibacillus kushneri TaxID=237682 RepID=A0A1H9Y375_9BACI|nr:GntR family transcriptional regulator [Salinibacillus kushneri]SES63308.1 DNA-binding transcriptional regulator YhcF, GntR family [Salinibacillus kushneri]